MAKKTKSFDCIKMKREIQAKLYRRWKGLSTTEIVAQISKDVAESTDPLIVKLRNLPTAEERRAQQAQQRQLRKKKAL